MRKYLWRSTADHYNVSANQIEEGERPLDIYEIINKFFRRKRLFLYIVIPIFLVLAINNLVKPYTPIYRATFDVGVTKERPLEGFFSGYTRYQEPTMQIGTVTQRVIASLLSVNLAEKVVDELNLCSHTREEHPDVEINLRMKQDFNDPLGPFRVKLFEGTMAIYRDGQKVADSVYGRFSVYKNGQKITDGVLGEYVDLGYVELKVVPLNKHTIDKTYEVTIYPRHKMALALRNSLSIKVLEADKIDQEFGSSDIPFSGEDATKQMVTAKTIFPGMSLIGILRIGVHWGNPDDALRIANALSRQVIIEDRIAKSLQFTQSRTFIDSQLTFYQSNLTKLEDEVRRFKERKRITDLKASTQALITQISDLESRRNQLQIEENILTELSNYLASDKARIEAVPNFAATMLSELVLRDFYSQLLQTEAELRGRLKEYSSTHPKVLEIKAKLEGLKEQMKEEVNKRMSTIITEIASFDTQIRVLQARLENVPLDEISLARLERDRETAEKLYTFFAEKFEETRVQEAGVTSDLNIINPALVAPGPVNSRGRLKNLVISFVIAIMMGTCAVLIVDYVDTSIKEPAKISKKIGLSMFASIPVIEDKKETVEQVSTWKMLLEKIRLEIDNNVNYIKKIINQGKQEDIQESLKLLGDNITSPEFEAFRKLSINLDFVYPHKRYHVIYISSPGPAEGKTFIAANLGIVLCKIGKKVLMVDTDFRKKSGHLTDVIKLKKELGLFDILKGDVETKDVILPFKQLSEERQKYQQDEKEQIIHLLPLGKIPPNPFVFLESEKMKEVIDELKGDYDYIIIDGVPLLLFADATYIANFTDGVLITVRYGKTGFKEFENARDILINAKSNIIGFVMNGVPTTRGSYYYQQYYKYYSKYYRDE